MLPNLYQAPLSSERRSCLPVRSCEARGCERTELADLTRASLHETQRSVSPRLTRLISTARQRAGILVVIDCHLTRRSHVRDQEQHT